jgi:predicted Zn-dependent protease
VRDRSVNAFALPGGYVGVHLGLIAITTTPDELASVLAHELAHVTQRHIARSMDASARSRTLGMAAMLLGLLAASRSGSPDMAQAAIMGGQAAMAQGQLNFSRDMEREADRIGYGVLAPGLRRPAWRPCSTSSTPPTGSTTTAPSPTCAATR